jgi:diacylglycerol O-acyltransferase
MTTPVAPHDLTWLLMDRPNNLMYVHGLLWFRQRPDWHEVEQVLQDRLVGRFPVFGRRAREVDGTWVWEDDPDFTLGRHVRRMTLPAPGTREQAEAYISSRFSEPFDADHPLWEMDLVDGVHDLAGSDGAMVFARFHHGIADGIRLVQVLMSLLDPLAPVVHPPAVGRSGLRRGMRADAMRVARATTTGTVDFVAGTASALTRSSARVSRLHPRALRTTAGHLRRPTRITDAISEVASEDNSLVNTWRSVARLALSGRSVTTVWSGTPGVQKRVAWIDGLSLDEVKRIGKDHQATVNDVLLGAVSLGLTRYLAEQGETAVDQVTWLVPVSLRPMSAEPPAELGNQFVVVQMPMPIGITEPDRLLRQISRRMSRIKNSAEPVLIYGIQRAIAETPTAVSVGLTNYVANKALGVLTNVPGPQVPLGLAGAEVSGVLGWVPSSGDQPLGICIFSYNGSINIGIAADAGLVPEPGRLADLIEQAVVTLGEESAAAE